MTYPTYIDNLAFAKKNETLTLLMAIEQLPRLAEQLGHDALALKAGHEDKIHCTLKGQSDDAANHYLALNIEANLTAQCQRCMDAMPLPVSLAFKYKLSNIVADEVEPFDDIDLLEIEQKMDVTALVEDELIAALPIAPAHAEGCTLKHNVSGDKANPFAVLKGLIK
jgi:uncharacterized protein